MQWKKNKDNIIIVMRFGQRELNSMMKIMTSYSKSPMRLVVVDGVLSR